MTNTCATEIDKEIIDLLTTNNTATVCCCGDNLPYCFNIFYAVLEDEHCLVFKSSENTRHMEILATNNSVAGTVVSSANSMTRIQGIQFEGAVAEKNSIGFKATRAYYSRYPFAMAMPGNIWIVELHSIKYTSTVNGIKHKLAWRK